MADRIQGSISKADFKIKNGKLKIHKRKLKSDVAEKVDKETASILNDTVSNEVRKKINKETRDDINPAKGAHNIVSDTKAKISKEIGKDLGLDMN